MPLRLRAVIAAVILASALPALTATASHAAYAGDNGLIAFVRGGQVFTITPNGTDLTQLTTDGGSEPVWSPNGRRIAYVDDGDIWMMRADGSNQQQVTTSGSASGPSWSPDGRWLAFGSPLQRVRASAPFGEPKVFGARLLGECCSDEPWSVRGSVAWSSDGDHIAFVSGQYPSSPDTYLLEYSISRHTIDEIDNIGGSCCGSGTFDDPFYAADGSGPFYTTDVNEGQDEEDLPPEFAMTTPGGAFPSRPYDQQGAPSPDGSAIAFMNDANDRPHVLTQDLDGSDRAKLSRGYSPDWQPTNTVPWAPPPPPDPDTLAPLMFFHEPAPFVVGRSISRSNYFDASPDNDVTRASVRLSWRARDPESGMCGYDVERENLDGSTSPVATTGTSFIGSGNNADFGTPYVSKYAITGSDCSGNTITGAWYTWIRVADDSDEGPSLNPIEYAGTWATSTFDGWSGGTTHKTTEPGSTATIEVYGESAIGVVMATGPDRGAAEVLLDGEVVTTVNTNSSERHHRVVVATLTTPDDENNHTVTVRNLGTPGAPRVDVDAFLLSF